MRNLRNLIALGLLVVAMIFAQDATAQKLKPSKGKRGGQKMEQLKAELNLSDSQVKSIEKINQEFREKRKATKDLADKKGAGKAMRAEHDAAINAILTPEQQTKFATMKKDKGNRPSRPGKKGNRDGKGKVKGKKGGQKMAAMQKELGLNDAQMAKIKTANKNLNAKKKALKAQGLTKEESKKAMKPLRKEHDKTLKGIMTKEQYKKYKAMKKAKKENKANKGSK